MSAAFIFRSLPVLNRFIGVPETLVILLVLALVFALWVLWIAFTLLTGISFG